MKTLFKKWFRIFFPKKYTVDDLRVTVCGKEIIATYKTSFDIPLEKSGDE